MYFREWAIALFVLSFADVSRADESLVDFAREIRPLLSDRCYACHGPDREGQENDLRLDVPALAVASAIVPGRAAESPLIERVTSQDPETRMPPPASKREPLSSAEIALLRRWIDQGAVYTDHWAYQPPSRPEPPSVERADWSTNAIDRFVLSQLEQHGVEPSGQADRRTRIRRLSFDLLGLPPTPRDVQAFLGDGGSDAYERLVDRLLESQHLGERLAMLWLDLVRFADTCGYHGDQHREIDAYRDYVIDSFNKNKPFDRFTIEQLAGDLLPSATREQIVGSGYNRLLQTTEEGGAQPREYRAIYAADRVRNISSVWLGTTLGCAQCHDHKFDPFTSGDFYRAAAFFDDVEEVAVGRQAANFELATAEQRAELASLETRIQALQASNTGSMPPESEAEASTNGQLAEQIKALEKRREELRQQVRKTLVTHAAEPRMTRILPRGNWLDESGPLVKPAIPALFGRLETSSERATRLDLAQWLVSPRNPLTARVFVNHLWRMMFGVGLVRTPDDFGSQGQYPTHRELLDWLAVDFQESGWNVKRMLRQIALSQTYQQSSIGTPDLRRLDPFNLWLARQQRFRLDAEIVRDNALSVSGLLVPIVGGSSVKPYQPVGYWDQLNFPKRTYEPNLDENQYRRGVYTYWCRTFLHPSLVAFDAPTREECTAQRSRSNTPLQALVLLNDPTYVESARALAQRVLAMDTTSFDATLAAMWNEVLSRSPSEDERSIMRSVYEQQRRRFESDREAAEALIRVGQLPGDTPAGDDLSELAAWTSAARVVLNLHETITRE